MGLKYTKQHTIKSYETDRFGRVSLSMLARLLLHVSSEQTAVLTSSYDKMQAAGLSWFILQHDMTIHQLPCINDTILIETEAVAYNQFFTYRVFRVYLQDVCIVETLMKFAMVDVNERKLVRLAEDYLIDYQAERVKKPMIMQKVDKLTDVSETKSYRVRYTDIDSNQHVNNAIYFDWLIDSLPESFLMTHQPTNVSIVYEKEVIYGQTVQSLCVQDDLTTYHAIQLAEDSVCRAMISWR